MTIISFLHTALIAESLIRNPSFTSAPMGRIFMIKAALLNVLGNTYSES